MTLYDFTVKDAKGNEVSLAKYKGKVVLVVNTATKCGLTPQYAGLQELYEKYHDSGLEILDFPCNQFNDQAPESIEEIAEFRKKNYGATFPLFAKIDVNGEHEIPLYAWLKSQKGGLLKADKIAWNFAKFLLDREGNVVARFTPIKAPAGLEKDIRKLLAVG
jgi:glutathione peroxidase